ncbi:TetR/AcrR family transcriptional regulator [Furfurilactobacillus siliginis]|uniref:TetR family transcriptional regulator n=1 Tax=Furfurilactobacillus siliginis TaxID=348151 RepID=A0A0R2LBA1_9LACO|nr:TetR/AcrR family transcriptional regulator [Furfurilactobacillus siliginis]KRN96007.1 TetR family transcriptional regulator [Furfurilactobacillus siliginis]GEK28822.1 hypothetical protein LSI01_11330 [Furfurilactobacillus siliginis]
MPKESTEAQILTAFGSLLKQNGYDSITTKRIAATAGVNESTLFRHFVNKDGLMDALLEKYLRRIDEIKLDFAPSGDITVDLMWVAKTYAAFINDHAALFFVALRNNGQFPSVDKLPLRFRTELVEAFQRLQQTGEIRADLDAETEAINFMLINFGHMVFKMTFPGQPVDIPAEKFVETNVVNFAEHLK